MALGTFITYSTSPAIPSIAGNPVFFSFAQSFANFHGEFFREFFVQACGMVMHISLAVYAKRTLWKKLPEKRTIFMQSFSESVFLTSYT